jgi:hypothetical protein
MKSMPRALAALALAAPLAVGAQTSTATPSGPANEGNKTRYDAPADRSLQDAARGSTTTNNAASSPTPMRRSARPAPDRGPSTAGAGEAGASRATAPSNRPTASTTKQKDRAARGSAGSTGEAGASARLTPPEASRGVSGSGNNAASNAAAVGDTTTRTTAQRSGTSDLPGSSATTPNTTPGMPQSTPPGSSPAPQR